MYLLICAKHNQFSWLQVPHMSDSCFAKLQAPHTDFQKKAQVRGVSQQRSATSDAAWDVSHFVVL
jgi:hypothetical protein